METDPARRATELFAQGFSCSQAVFAAFAPQYGLGEDYALRVAGLFGAGMSRSGQVCGAVSGGMMVLGLAYGSTDPTNTSGKERAYAIGQEFMQAFQEQNDSLLCQDLIGYDLRMVEELQAARDAGVFKRRCPGYVSSVAEILERYLIRDGEG